MRPAGETFVFFVCLKGRNGMSAKRLKMRRIRETL
jgi:hypothetical protein